MNNLTQAEFYKRPNVNTIQTRPFAGRVPQPLVNATKAGGYFVAPNYRDVRQREYAVSYSCNVDVTLPYFDYAQNSYKVFSQLYPQKRTSNRHKTSGSSGPAPIVPRPEVQRQADLESSLYERRKTDPFVRCAGIRCNTVVPAAENHDRDPELLAFVDALDKSMDEHWFFKVGYRYFGPEYN
ncbi:hypothetical protein FA15DRAFT_754232 [Coprinopsis marcescibilis]|uniref:Uncharacterized protein n=1 Tax=Coprinopsis marcescibilis TaxID=230819 RepID=A0A5C3LG44_COPMA|nr:hypothetical protein FA15DRAFT_754232 [Coprinopsis marcescibilis]